MVIKKEGDQVMPVIYHNLVQQITRYAITGGSGLLANLILLGLLVEVFLVSEVYAGLVSTSFVLFGTFVVTEKFVFKDENTRNDLKAIAFRGGSYYLVMATGKLINYGLYIVFIGIGIWYILSWVLGSVIVFVGTFSANRILWKYFAD
ncbi:MAG: GtrA family protein [Halobacteriota archaeon]